MRKATTPKSSTVAWDTDSEEFFSFMGRVWDVREAKRRLDKKPREVYQIPVKDLAVLVSKPGTMTLGVTVDWEAAKEADVSVPVILLGPKDGHLPIDGYHRIAKAVLDGLETLPAVCLTDRETKSVRMP